MRISAVLCCVSLFAFSAFSGINIKIATSEQIAAGTSIGACAGDTNFACSNHGASQHRYNGYKFIRDGGIESYAGCVPNINFPKGNPPFSCGIADQVSPPYLVYAKPEKFIVPQTGTYSLYLRYNVFAFIMIDGKLLNQTLDGAPRVFTDNPFELVGTVESGAVASNSIRNVKTTIDLTEGEHNVEIMFSAFDHESMFILLWKKPGDTDYEIIPSSAFGAQDCDKCGTSVLPRMAIKNATANAGFVLNGTELRTTNSRIAKVEMYDIRGRKAGSFNLEGKSSVQLGNMSGSFYMVRGFDAQGKSVGSAGIMK